MYKALLPVCMKHTAQSESEVHNRAWGKAHCHGYLSWDSHQVQFYTNGVAIYKCFFVFYTS